MSPDPTRELEEAVSRARERLDALSPLLEVANHLDLTAEEPRVAPDGPPDGSA